MSHGTHVKLQGRGAPALLGSADLLKSVLKLLVETVGMRILGGPHIYEVELEIEKLGKTPFEDEGGVTGIAVLSTSHVAIHTWPARPFFILDLFSCREFDLMLVERVVIQRLGAYNVQTTDLSSALEYPAEW